MLEGKTMLPKVGIGRRCGAIQANIDRYRALMTDEMYEELVALGKELAGVKICHLNSTAAGALKRAAAYSLPAGPAEPPW